MFDHSRRSSIFNATAGKKNADDSLLLMEAIPAGMQPIMVTLQACSDHTCSDHKVAEGAIGKFKKVLNRTYDKLTHPQSQASFSGDQALRGSGRKKQRTVNIDAIRACPKMALTLWTRVIST